MVLEVLKTLSELGCVWMGIMDWLFPTEHALRAGILFVLVFGHQKYCDCEMSMVVGYIVHNDER